MGSPRIDPTRTPELLERLAAFPIARYATALATVALAEGVISISAGSIGVHARVLYYFVAILISAVFAGLGPGLVALAGALLTIHFFSSALWESSELRLLTIEGILVSAVGGFLRSVRLKARDRLKANRELEQQILEIGDDERRRIGLDLHDGLGQHLTGISLISETVAQQMASGHNPDPANIETITRLVSESVRITRDLAKTLSPVTLERDGLIAAVEELANTSCSLFGIDCRPEIDCEEMPLDLTRSLHVFRIAQEAVNNSVRHGKAKNVRIRLSHDKNQVSLTVTDDGSGLSQKTVVNPGLGLRIMQYRAQILGAKLSAERAGPSGGTIVTCLFDFDGQSIRS